MGSYAQISTRFWESIPGAHTHTYTRSKWTAMGLWRVVIFYREFANTKVDLKYNKMYCETTVHDGIYLIRQVRTHKIASMYLIFIFASINCGCYLSPCPVPVIYTADTAILWVYTIYTALCARYITRSRGLKYGTATGRQEHCWSYRDNNNNKGKNNIEIDPKDEWAHTGWYFSSGTRVTLP